jgi:glycosyltransferase involved in cell wall biosynthesis
MKISVVIPAYNAAPWIGRAIQSVLDQTVRVAEIIVVDDESRDNTGAVVTGFADRVRYICQSNGGPAKARNTGVCSSSGDWLAFLDADDWWGPTKIERQIAALQANPNAILAYTSLNLVKDSGQSEVREAPPAEKLWPALRYSNPISPSSVLLKRSAFDVIGGFDERHRGTEDWEAWVRLHWVGEFVGLIEPLTNYRVAPGSLSSDATHMFKDFLPMVERTLVQDLRGVRRWAWKRRILASQAYSAALIAREAANTRQEKEFLVHSLTLWPLPSWQGRRFLALVVLARRILRAQQPAVAGSR